MPIATESYEMRAARVAKLWCGGMKQSEIAEIFGPSASTISRMLEYAEKQNWIQTSRVLREDQLPLDIRSKLFRGVKISARVDETCKLLSPNVHVTSTVIDAVDISSFCERVAVDVANVFGEHVASTEGAPITIGVTGGQTVARVIDGVRSQWGHLKAGKHLRAQCIPLCGEALSLVRHDELPYSASQLAADLESVMTGERTSFKLPTLAGVPAYVPRRYQPAPAGNKRLAPAAGSVLDFVRSGHGYREIFGPSNRVDGPLVNSLDAVLTGVGIVDQILDGQTHQIGRYLQERIEQEKDELDPLKMHAWVYGEIGGALLGRPKLDEQGRQWVAALDSGWTGLQLEHLKRVARQASNDSNFPGVIVVAFGQGKAECLCEAIRRGVVNHLIVDTKLGTAICQLAEKADG